jgi:putative ABC transport system permease protein
MMKSLMTSGLLRRKKLASMFIIALGVIFTMLPFLYGTLIKTQTLIDSDIKKNYRGTYDILVRPEGSRNDIEKKYGLVEENYLGIGQGGISIRDYEKIKSLDGVDIAAPIASLGYFTGISRAIVLPMPDRSERISVQFYTSDGIHRYPVGPKGTGYVINNSGTDTIDKLADFHIFNAFMSTRNPAVIIPQTYHLLVAIDPDSEEKLTGISFKKLKTKNRPFYYDKLTFGNAPIFPVMKLTDAVVPLSANIEVEDLRTDPSTVSSLKQKYGIKEDQRFAKVLKRGEATYKKLLNDLDHYVSGNKRTYTIDISKYLDPFLSNPLMIDKNYHIKMNTEVAILQDAGNTSVYYKTSDISYEIENVNQRLLAVRELGKIGHIPVYRETKKMGVARSESDKVPFVLNPVGSYSEKMKINKLTASPLGIYGLTPTVSKETGKTVHSTILPGSYVSSPASGVTTLAAAKLIKGQKPIDVIRIRVGGIHDYNEAAEKKIRDVAGKIASLGFDVDIVAGASYQKMDVDVEGTGHVLEPWTTLGAAVTIHNSWNGLAVMLMISFAIIGVLYLFTRLAFWRVDKQKENLLLTQLGWEEKDIQKKAKFELVVLTFAAFVLSVLVTMIIREILFGSIIQALAVQSAILLVTFFIILFSPFKLGKRKPSDKIKSGRLLRKNLHYYKAFIRLPFVQILLTTFVSAFSFLVIVANVKKTNLTSLGQYINLHASTYHIIFILGAYLLAVFTMIEGQMTLLKVRSTETRNFISIGWAVKDIVKLYLMEMAIWAGAAILLGTAIALLVCHLVFAFYLSLTVYTILISATFYVLVLFVSYLTIRFRF